MVLFVKKRSIIIIFTIICLAVVIAGVKIYLKKENKILIGGSLEVVECIADNGETFYNDVALEKYFRPSNLTILNNKDINKLIWENDKEKMLRYLKSI